MDHLNVVLYVCQTINNNNWTKVDECILLNYTKLNKKKM